MVHRNTGLLQDTGFRRRGGRGLRFFVHGRRLAREIVGKGERAHHDRDDAKYQCQRSPCGVPFNALLNFGLEVA